MTRIVSLEDNQLDHIAGGGRQLNVPANVPGVQNLGNILSRIGSIFSAINISVIVIANSTINGNVNINLGQSVKL